MVLQCLYHAFRRWSALEELDSDVNQAPLSAELILLAVFAVALLKEVTRAGKQPLNQLGEFRMHLGVAFHVDSSHASV